MCFEGGGIMNRVMIINDSKFECIIIKDIISKRGYSVKITDEFNALKEVSIFLPHIVFVNYIMEKVRGDILIEAIKQKNPSIKCILTSSNELDKSTFKQNMIDDFVCTAKGLSSLKETLSSINLDIDFTPKEISNKKSVKKEIEKVIEDTSRHFCPYCGQKLDIKNGNKFLFCPYCGSKL